MWLELNDCIARRAAYGHEIPSHRLLKVTGDLPGRLKDVSLRRASTEPSMAGVKNAEWAALGGTGRHWAACNECLQSTTS